MASLKRSGPDGLAGFVEHLRRLQEVGPVVQVLGYLGGILVGTGVAWASWQFVNAHRYVVCILTGLTCLAFAALARPEGILSSLPMGLQDFLLRTTWYDMCYEDSGFQNTMRKWGRMLMLCYLPTPTPGQVRAVTDGLDPSFVDMVFRRTFIYNLPLSVRTLLLPTPRRRCLWPQASPEARVQEAYVEGVGSAFGLPEDLGGTPIDAKCVAKILKEKVANRNKAIVEPDLGPAVTALGMCSLRPTLLTGLSTVAKRAAQAIGVGAVGCFGWAALLRLPTAQRLLQQCLSGGSGLQRSLSTSDSSTTTTVARVGRVATALGVLGVGGMVAFMSFSSKLGRAGTDARVAELEAKLARQAEEHEEALAKLAAASKPGATKGEAESDDSTADSLS